MWKRKQYYSAVPASYAAGTFKYTEQSPFALEFRSFGNEQLHQADTA